MTAHGNANANQQQHGAEDSVTKFRFFHTSQRFTGILTKIEADASRTFRRSAHRMSAPTTHYFPLYILTPRLVLRNWTLEDLPVAHALYSDPEVMRFSPDGPSPSLEATRTILAGHIASYVAHGIGRWAVALRANGEVIGECGVTMEPVHGLTPEPELGYRLRTEFQKHGYATEAAKAALQHCLSLVGLPRILGIVELENTTSARTLLKLGLALQGQTVWRGKTVEVYAIDRLT